MKHFLPVFIALLVLTGCRTEDYTKGQPAVCEVHHVHMVRTSVPIVYGLPRFTAQDAARYVASTNAFPHFETCVLGGCCVGPRDAHRAVIYECPECKKAAQEWDASYSGSTNGLVKTDSVVFVMGDVSHPGRIMWIPGLTLTNAISLVGGFTEFADQSQIDISHSNGTREKFNYQRVVSAVTNNPTLMPGDLVHVERRLF